ncbi:MAG: hypothetical protein MI702_08335 [Chlorobiales bacterium]|nr:hypothetical protein [Chlorobiales bacterium]
MPEKASHRVNFALVRIITENIDLTPDSFEEGKPAKINTGLNFGIDTNRNFVKVLYKNTFQQNEKNFIEIEVACIFTINEESWQLFSNKEEGKFILPKGLAGHLAMLTASTARGILHNETEGTPFNRYFIPANNVNDMLPSDVVMPLENH